MRSAAHFFIRWGLLASIVFLLSGCRTPKAGTPPEYGLSIENARVVYNRTSNTVSYSLELVNNSGSARRVAWTDATTNPLTSFILHNADSGDEFVLNRTPSTSYYFAMEPFVIRPGKRKILSGQDQIDTKRSRLYFWRWDSNKLNPRQQVNRQGMTGEKLTVLPNGNYSARVRILVTWWDGIFSKRIESAQGKVLTVPAGCLIEPSN